MLQSCPSPRSRLAPDIHPFLRIRMRHELAVRIGAPRADLGKLRIGQAHVVAMRKIINQRRAGGILVAFGELLDLPQACSRSLVMRRV